MTWSPPPPVPQGPSLSDHVGDLVYIKVLEYLANYPFPFGIKDGIRVDFEVLDGRSEVGERQPDVMLSNLVLVKQLRDGVGREYFGRVATGRGSNASPPIHLDPPRPGDERLIDAFLARQQGRPAPAPQAYPPQAQPYPPAQAYQPGYGQQGPGNGYPQQAPQPAYAQPAPAAPNPGYVQPPLPGTVPGTPPPAPAGMPPAAPPPRYGTDDPPPF